MLDVMLWILHGVNPLVIHARQWDDAGLHQMRISSVALSVLLTFGFVLQSDCNRFLKMHLSTHENRLEAWWHFPQVKENLEPPSTWHIRSQRVRTHGDVMA